MNDVGPLLPQLDNGFVRKRITLVHLPNATVDYTVVDKRIF